MKEELKREGCEEFVSDRKKTENCWHNTRKEKGVEKQAEESAVKFLNEKVSPEVIAKCVGITLERVLELQKGIK